MQVIKNWKDVQKIESESELQKVLHQLRKDLVKLYNKKFNGKLKDVSLIKKTKKNIARVLMQINNLKKSR